MLVGCSTALLLVTYNPNDPSFNSVTYKYPSNLLGHFGAYLADLFYQLFGIASFILPICCIFWSLSVWRLKKQWATVRIIAILLSIISLSIVCTNIKINYLPAGAGGTTGTIIYPIIKQLDSRADYVLNKLYIYIYIFYMFSSPK